MDAGHASDPRGQTATEADARRRASRPGYAEARDEYDAIRELRKRNWIAAHVRERRWELGLTQQQVAEIAATSHTYISKLEGGDLIPTLPVLVRILGALDEELLIGIQPRGAEAGTEPELAPVPTLAAH